MNNKEDLYKDVLDHMENIQESLKAIQQINKHIIEQDLFYNEEDEIKKIKQNYHWSHIWDKDIIIEELINHQDDKLMEKIISDKEYFNNIIKKYTNILCGEELSKYVKKQLLNIIKDNLGEMNIKEFFESLEEIDSEIIKDYVADNYSVDELFDENDIVDYINICRDNESIIRKISSSMDINKLKHILFSRRKEFNNEDKLEIIKGLFNNEND